MEIIRFENYSFSYPNNQTQTLKNISFSINEGEFVCICGKSGSGKTTLLKALKPIFTPKGEKEGTVYFNGENINKLSSKVQAGDIGFIMQNPSRQIVTDKVWHELAFGLENLGENNLSIKTRIAEISNYFGIDHWFNKDTATLSLGQKQILNLASVMAMNPKLLILDEPTSALDSIYAQKLLFTLKKINQDQGVTIILCDHKIDEVYDSLDRLICLDNGKIIANDSPRNVPGQLQNFQGFLPVPTQIYMQLSKEDNYPISTIEGKRFLKKLIPTVTKDRLTIAKEKTFKGKAIEIKELCFKYERKSEPIIQDLNLNIPKNSLYSIMGNNGIGKSTLLKLITKQLKPDFGTIKIFDKNIKSYKDKELFTNFLAMLPQNPLTLFLKSTVKEEIEQCFDTDKEKYIKLFNLEPLLNKHPFDLSGGEVQKLGLLKVLLSDPSIIILDEPTKGMDYYAKEDLGQLLTTFTDKTVIIVSHDLEFCGKYSDFVALFFDKSIVTQGKPQDFFINNSFYTTVAHKMSKDLFYNTITKKQVIELCQNNLFN